jgi:hypothetical protein
MDHQAHGLDLKHAVFNTPNKVTFSWTKAPTEEQYQNKTSVLYPQGIGDRLKLTKFEHTQGYWNSILVNHEGFFTDVPGLENLAEGHSAKVLGSVSLVRQGRYFYWGYSIDPERMTKAAQDTLVNVLHYMHKKRDSLTVKFVCKTRQILWTYLDLNRRKPRYKRGIEEHFPNSLTPECRKTYNDSSAEGCAAWLDKYLPYVFSGKSEKHTDRRYKNLFEVDADAMALGTSNARRESLERWIDLAAGDDQEKKVLAERCLKRYVHPSIAPKDVGEDGGWAGWYQKQKDRIVFVESTGFWWQEDPRVLERERAAGGR